MPATAIEPEAPLITRLTEVALRYQQVLKHNPRQPEALVAMSLVALASRQTEAALQMAAAAVHVAPEMGSAWVTLAQALKSAGRNDEAEHAYREAIRLDGMNTLARLGLGELKVAVGRPKDAIEEYEFILRQQPDLVAAHLGLGHALASMGRDAEALDRYIRALALQPNLPEAEFAAGFVLVRLGRQKEAERRYRRAVTLQPDLAAAWINLGSLLREQGREIFAEAALLRGMELRPDLVSGWVNLAVLERERKQLPKAEAYLHKAFALNPEHMETLLAWCQLRVAERDMAGAWGWLRWALARDPENDEALNMHGILLHLEGRLDEAVESFRRAEVAGNRTAASNRGNSLLDLGRIDEALVAYAKAVERDPTHPGARYNLSLSQLRTGDWKRGWANYEARWRFRDVHRNPRKFREPRWQGEPLEGRRILLHAEQGLGDTIQFCRYLSLVVARGGVPVLQVRPPLEPLMQSLSAVCSGQAEVARWDAKVLPSEPPFDLECPLMSLPGVFGTAVDTVPWPGAYLGADPKLVEAKWAEFPRVWTEAVPSLRVGFAWAGNPRYKADAQRSTKLETLLPLLRVAGVTWISLQKGEPAEQLAGLPGDIAVSDGSSKDRDLAETAALIATLDLVITTDTCIAHLAGAMAKPVWIMLPFLADWRWMQNRETTPWYPTARLLRQRQPGDWAGLLERVIADLAHEYAHLRCNAHRVVSSASRHRFHPGKSGVPAAWSGFLR